MNEQTYNVNIKVSQDIKIDVTIKREMSVTEFITFTERVATILNNVKPVEEKRDILSEVVNSKLPVVKFKRKILGKNPVCGKWTKDMVNTLRQIYGTMPVKEIQQITMFNDLPLTNIYNKASDMRLTTKVKRLGIKHGKN
jgi:hypothetical protein